MVSAVCGGIRVASIYAPNGRVVDSPFYLGKLRWFERLAAWAADGRSAADGALVIGGDYNVTPTDDDVWDRRRGARRHACLGSPSARRSRRFGTLGLVRRVPRAPAGARPVLVVGLPGRHVPQEHGHAHRPAVRHARTSPPGRVGRDRPRGTQGAAHAVGPRAGGHRPRRRRARRSTPAGRPPCPASPRARGHGPRAEARIGPVPASSCKVSARLAQAGRYRVPGTPGALPDAQRSQQPCPRPAPPHRPPLGCCPLRARRDAHAGWLRHVPGRGDAPGHRGTGRPDGAWPSRPETPFGTPLATDEPLATETFVPTAAPTPRRDAHADTIAGPDAGPHGDARPDAHASAHPTAAAAAPQGPVPDGPVPQGRHRLRVHATGMRARGDADDHQHHRARQAGPDPHATQRPAVPAGPPAEHGQARRQGRRAHRLGPGADQLGYGDWAVRSHRTRGEAIRAAAKALRMTGDRWASSPGGAPIRGSCPGSRPPPTRRSPTATRSPTVAIEDVWYPRISSIWGPSDATRHVDAASSDLPQDFLPYRRPDRATTRASTAGSCSCCRSATDRAPR